jgi:hypothetical protein
MTNTSRNFDSNYVQITNHVVGGYLSVSRRNQARCRQI